MAAKGCIALLFHNAALFLSTRSQFPAKPVFSFLSCIGEHRQEGLSLPCFQAMSLPNACHYLKYLMRSSFRAVACLHGGLLMRHMPATLGLKLLLTIQGTA